MTFSRSKLKRKDTLDHPDEEGEEEDEEERRRREEEEEKTKEPQIEIRLSTTTAQPASEVIYDFASGHYQSVQPGDPLIHLFTSPCRIMPREEYELKQMQKAQMEVDGEEERNEEEVQEEIMRRKKEEEEKQKKQYMELQREFKGKKKGGKKKKKPQKEKEEEEEEEEEEDDQYDIAKDIEELYGNVMSPEQLAKLDSQPNPFNFSDRVSQSFRPPMKELAQQTDQPPSTTFGANAGLAILCDAYDGDYEMKEEALRRKKEREEKEKAEKEGDKDPNAPPDPMVLLPPPPPPDQGGLAHLDKAARIVERIVQQNVYDEGFHDYKYWEDQSDDYRQLEGSLLPLWRLTAPLSRRLFVCDVTWSPAHPDLLAVAYSAGESGEPPEPGYLCLFSLKNPCVPERCLPCPCGVTCVRFHPEKESVLVAGQEDGAVLVYDARHATTEPPHLAVSTSRI
ncbi:dynein intermediate chain 2, ciliary-like [Eriocheir sinensis]|uniref:dynein intermediate chain 2, ciliary-like n=1 Tax=Eriocheir sinensis TaxID=95602 RepID=UPI0021C6BBDE|nr:dynein intermediate chain 2, ciliary-like [Eriocheir sinensis]